MVAVHKWKTKQLDYVAAYSQALVKKELYMKIPKGFKLCKGDPNDYVLKLHKNFYGQKQSETVWNQYLIDKLVNKVGFKQ